MSSRTLTLLICLLTGIAVLSCKGPEEEPVASTGASSSSGSSSVTPGVVNNDIGFKVEVSSEMDTKMLTYTHQRNATTECAVTDVSAFSSIDCIVEVEELDLYFHGMKLAYNVPEDMCEYFMIRPYYFYQYEPGNGDTGLAAPNNRIEVEVLANGTAQLIEPGTHTGASALNAHSGTAEGDGGTAGAVTGTASYPNTFLSGAVPKCRYDYTLESTPGPNCCVGSYTFIQHTQDAAGAWTSSSAATVEWGGLAQNCLAGPAMATQEIVASTGHPKSDIEYSNSVGSAGVYTIDAPIELGHYSTVYASNFINTMFSAATRATATTAGAFTNTEPFYYFACLDRAFRIKAQIRVAIREWNQASDYLAADGTALTDNEATSDTGGAEASGGAIDDFEDWDVINPGTGNSGSAYPKAWL